MASEIARDCLYAENHEWLRIENGIGTVGISDYAQDELTDVVYVELPVVGGTFEQGAPFAVVESVKAASDVFMPASGEIVAVNATLEETPEAVNDDPFGQGWFVRIKIANADELGRLMDADAYEAYLATLSA